MTTNTSPTSTDRLLLEPDTRMTCPGCKQEFGLAEGFAKKTLEQFTQSSKGALDDLTKSIRDAEAQRLTQKSAGEQQLLEEQIRDLKNLMAQQAKQHGDSLQQVRELEKQAAATREKALTEQIETLRGKQEEIATKEKAISEREQDLQKHIDRGPQRKPNS